MLHFEDLDIEIPERLETAEFILRPITSADAERDYAAVMESREFLRLWEQSTWPEDDFTVEANREDMELIERRHASRESFTYTVMNAEETECLGCVYIMPTDARAFTASRITQVGSRTWDDFDAAVYFWVRKSHLPAGTDRALLEALQTWLASDWGFHGHLLITSEPFAQQVEMIENAGLQLQFTIEEIGKPGRSLAFE